MKAEYEFMNFLEKISLELNDLVKKSVEEGFTSVQISIDENGVANVWAKEPYRGYISACHNAFVKDNVKYQYAVSQYDEKIGDWV